MHQHIISNCKEKKIFLQEVNGYTEHVHCLISLGRDQTIAQVAQLIKGESSFWINKNDLMPEKFTWQDDYWAVSVGESELSKIVNYIKNQESHHEQKPFTDEVEELEAKYGLARIKDE
ncbi:MAG: transposase [Bacteroidales bacterium]